MQLLKHNSSKIPTSIWVLGFVSLLMDISSEMIHSLLPLFMVTTLGTSVLAVGFIEGLAEATALIVKIFSGVLSDYIGQRKNIALLGYALGALSKPLFAITNSSGLLLSARLIDRVGKGIRGAPRDALVVAIAPAHLRGAAFGLRQSLDTIGAFLGPLLAVGLMLLWSNDFRAVFWVAVIPGFLAVLLLCFGIKEPNTPLTSHRINPLTKTNLQKLSTSYWWVLTIGALFMLARFSEAFLVLKGQQAGIPIALTPLIMVAMNIIYAATAYPFGQLSDRVSPNKLLILGVIILISANIVLANSHNWISLLVGLSLWGIHMGITQGLFAAQVAATSPADLNGTAYGLFNLISGIALLIASGLAGYIWDKCGSATTFYTGALFCLFALIAILSSNIKKS